MPPTGPEPATSAIAGVVHAGTPIVLVKDGFETVEGSLPQPDGGLLFTNNRMGRILRIAPDGAVSVWHEGPGGANALTRTAGGEIAATLTEGFAIAVIRPGEAPRILAIRIVSERIVGSTSYSRATFNQLADSTDIVIG